MDNLNIKVVCLKKKDKKVTNNLHKSNSHLYDTN